MSAGRDFAIKGVETALSEAVSKLSSTYENCLIEAAGDAEKEEACKGIRDRSLGLAKRAYADMLDAVNREWPQGSWAPDTAETKLPFIRPARTEPT